MRITRPPHIRTDDFAAFCQTLARQRDWFEAAEPVVVARAPGRLDVMGGIADYSGSLVLQMPIAEATFAAVQATRDAVVRVRSIVPGHTVREAELPLGVLEQRDLAKPRAWFAEHAAIHWSAYVGGVVSALATGGVTPPCSGLRILIGSDVPEGKGVSSSAALEVAVMRAVTALWDVTLDAPSLARLCQVVENRVVGAPCGLMDQMTAACGEQDRLLALLCQPGTILGQIELPERLRVWGIDSGIRHAVGGADYGIVRTAAFMGCRMIAERAGLPVESLEDGAVRVDDRRWGGYLANVTPSEWAAIRDRVPITMRGGAFLDRFGGITDPVTRVSPAIEYPVRAATAHPIGEHHRIRCFAKLLRNDADDETCRLLGEMMYQSHASYSACGLGSEGTDGLVELVRAAGLDAGLFGAKITGGGSGGTVAVLGRPDAYPAVAGIADRYARETGRETAIFRGSSSGAERWGTARLHRDATGPQR